MDTVSRSGRERENSYKFNKELNRVVKFLLYFSCNKENNVHEKINNNKLDKMFVLIYTSKDKHKYFHVQK